MDVSQLLVRRDRCHLGQVGKWWVEIDTPGKGFSSSFADSVFLLKFSVVPH